MALSLVCRRLQKPAWANMCWSPTLKVAGAWQVFSFATTFFLYLDHLHVALCDLLTSSAAMYTHLTPNWTAAILLDVMLFIYVGRP